MLASALRAFERFAAACPRRELFLEPRVTGDRAAMTHNEWTLILFATFLSSTTSTRTRKVVAVGTIRSYISLIKGYLGHVYAFEVADQPSRLRRFLESLQSDDSRGGRRKRRRAFRRSHLVRIWKLIPSARSHTAKAVNEMAILSTAWHILARGGEVAPAAFDPHSCLTRADLEFKTTSRGRRYAVVWLRPLKKKAAKHAPKIPQLIAEYDGGGADTYWALRRLVEHDPVPAGERAATPLFRTIGRDGRRHHFTTSSFTQLIRRRTRQLGESNPREWSAHSARIGGATDLASTGELNQLTLQAKGRWGSDIGKIYARVTRRSQLAVSGLMHRARGRDLEEIFPDYSQPAC